MFAASVIGGICLWGLCVSRMKANREFPLLRGKWFGRLAGSASETLSSSIGIAGLCCIGWCRVH